MKTPFTFALLMLTFLLASCNSHTPVNTDTLPTESELPQVPNCAADGPGCKQFNPDLK